ncbi:transmembrane emp24 domain trafficking protein 2 [Seminavis robusta]|uniref:Transmembrane emp24 domain trafficking protein 2 n=1 Tax=Seminavis robusta TaxID=568900 RepID=A0A9N8EHS1_9STRA|nr:transmembrane emp24 domain trafficking protein 2 [Seminavis robusta]|eukprot:Sro1210_g252770.1 transmembrane emp24 domain trafficking protein 2 (224) ;mRNA; f:19310-20090
MMKSNNFIGTLTVYCCLASLFLLIRQADASFAIAVPNGEEECFSIRVLTPSVISGSYDCLDDDVDGTMIKVSVKNEQTKEIKWKSGPEQTEGMFRLHVDPARYELCFQSEVPDDDEAAHDATGVGFALRCIPPPRTLPEGEEGPEAKRALQLVESASNIDQDWQNMLDHYDFLRTRESNHRELIEAIFTRLWKWTLIEAVLVVFMAFLQVMYLRKFFEQRRYL